MLLVSRKFCTLEFTTLRLSHPVPGLRDMLQLRLMGLGLHNPRRMGVTKFKMFLLSNLVVVFVCAVKAVCHSSQPNDR